MTLEVTNTEMSKVSATSIVKAKIAQFFRSSKAIVLIAIFVIKEIIFTHKFFLQTFFRASISDVSPPIKLKIGYGNKLQFKFILLLRFILKDQSWGQQWSERVQNSILENLKQQNLDKNQLKLKLTTIAAGEISPQEFWQKYVKTSTPVIIKGGAKHTDAYHNWSAEMFGDRFGNFEVNLLESDDFKSRKGKLKEVIDSRGGERKLSCYSFKIFSSYPELSDEVDRLNFQEYIDDNSSIFLGTQVLLSTHKSTGSRLHCEDLNTLFLQIKGRKKWTLIHPDYLWLMYPVTKLHMCTSAFKKDDDEQDLAQYYPLYQYCPQYEFILEPGDVLFNPTWFWHEVDNLEDETIAVANRWVSFSLKRTNTFIDLFQLLSPKVWQQQFSGLTKTPKKSNFLDSFG